MKEFSNNWKGNNLGNKTDIVVQNKYTWLHNNKTD